MLPTYENRSKRCNNCIALRLDSTRVDILRASNQPKLLASTIRKDIGDICQVSSEVGTSLLKYWLFSEDHKGVSSAHRFYLLISSQGLLRAASSPLCLFVSYFARVIYTACFLYLDRKSGILLLLRMNFYRIFIQSKQQSKSFPSKERPLWCHSRESTYWWKENKNFWGHIIVWKCKWISFYEVIIGK